MKPVNFQNNQSQMYFYLNLNNYFMRIKIIETYNLFFLKIINYILIILIIIVNNLYLVVKLI